MACIIHRGVNNGQAKLRQQNEYLALYVRGRKQTMACQWVPSHPWRKCEPSLKLPNHHAYIPSSVSIQHA